MSSLQHQIGKLEGAKLRAERRIKLALKRIDLCRAEGSRDVLRCISDVECILNGEAVKGPK